MFPEIARFVVVALFFSYFAVIGILPLYTLMPHESTYIFRLNTTEIKPEAVFNQKTVAWMRERSNNEELRLQDTGLGQLYYFYNWGYTVDYTNGTTRSEKIKNYDMDIEHLLLSDVRLNAADVTTPTIGLSQSLLSGQKNHERLSLKTLNEASANATHSLHTRQVLAVFPCFAEFATVMIVTALVAFSSWSREVVDEDMASAGVSKVDEEVMTDRPTGWSCHEVDEEMANVFSSVNPDLEEAPTKEPVEELVEEQTSGSTKPWVAAAWIVISHALGALAYYYISKAHESATEDIVRMFTNRFEEFGIAATASETLLSFLMVPFILLMLPGALVGH